MTDRLDVIAAFADGELVGADELKDALANAAAREYLIDVLALRGLVSGRLPETSAPQLPVPAGRQASAPAVSHRGRWLTAAAALIVAGVAGGFAVGRETAPHEAAEQTPTVVSTPAAPAPTHVFRMENGVNWNERNGGGN